MRIMCSAPISTAGRKRLSKTGRDQACGHIDCAEGVHRHAGYKKSASASMEEAKKLLQTAKDKKKGAAADVQQAEALLQKAVSLFDGFDYFDAARFAGAAKEWANYIQK